MELWHCRYFTASERSLGLEVFSHSVSDAINLQNAFFPLWPITRRRQF